MAWGPGVRRQPLQPRWRVVGQHPAGRSCSSSAASARRARRTAAGRLAADPCCVPHPTPPPSPPSTPLRPHCPRRSFERVGPPGEGRVYVFDGDLVDRGPWGLEVVLLLAAHKAAAPQSVYLVGGGRMGGVVGAGLEGRVRAGTARLGGLEPRLMSCFKRSPAGRVPAGHSACRDCPSTRPLPPNSTGARQSRNHLLLLRLRPAR